MLEFNLLYRAMLPIRGHIFSQKVLPIQSECLGFIFHHMSSVLSYSFQIAGEIKNANQKTKFMSSKANDDFFKGNSLNL